MSLELVLVLLASLWIVYNLLDYLVPYFHGLPSTPTSRERIRKALEMADLRAGETLYDLGSGYGRVLIIAAREFDAKAIGIDAGPVQTLRAWAGSLLNGVSSRVQVRMGNFLQADLSEADVVFAYLTSDYVPKLEQKLAAQLKPGARIVTISFDFSNWEPTAFDEQNLIFLYKMPPTAGNLGTYLAKHIR
ncbi:MAG: 50S ribosomal protein L11 methyltransferase [Chloroflexi bacterium]|nr:50S ribosomal protein L11 methyltransferase [Chloroflexota bacterium]